MRNGIVTLICASLLLVACGPDQAEREKAAVATVEKFYAAIKSGRYADAYDMFDPVYFTRVAEDIRTKEGWIKLWKEGEAQGATRFKHTVAVEHDPRPNANKIPVTVNAKLVYDPGTEFAKQQNSGTDTGDGLRKPGGYMQFIVDEVDGAWKIKNYEIRRDYSGFAR